MYFSIFYAKVNQSVRIETSQIHKLSVSLDLQKRYFWSGDRVDLRFDCPKLSDR